MSAPGPAASPRLDEGPVGPSQVGMLWHEQLAPGSFNLPSLVRRYRGRLDVEALGRALAELVRRHEPLRTTFEVRGGVALQVVRPAAFRLPVVALAHLDSAERDAEVARLIAAASTQPFDLVEGPLFAPSLLRLGLDDHVLVVRLHHLAFDDWSVEVFRRGLSALYAAFLSDEPSLPPEPATRFADVCRQQVSRLGGPAGAAERAHWRRRMQGAPFPVQLPLGDPSRLGPDRPGAGEPLRHDLPPDLARAVRALAPRLRATPFMTVLSAFELLVARRTGQDDLVLASVVAGRPTTALESLIGCFTKKVLLRVRLDGDPTFSELVARTRATVLDALAHQELAFEAVVEETLGPSAARHGLAAQVPVVFQGETPQQAKLVLPGLEIDPFEVPAAARRERHHSAGAAGEVAGPLWGDGASCGTFLLLSLLERPEGLGFVARGVFDRKEAQRLLEDLEGLLADVAAGPDRRLSDLAPVRPPALDPDHLGLRGLTLRRSRLEEALSRGAGVREVAVAVVEGGDGSDERRQPAAGDHGRPGPRPTSSGGGELVAYVVAEPGLAPTLAELRSALWRLLPGSAWPAAMVLVDRLPRHPDGRLDLTSLPSPRHAADPPDPRALLITSRWAEATSRSVTPETIYWQDFSFLQALAEARAAGLPITDEQVRRCRTPEMLAAALAARH